MMKIKSLNDLTRRRDTVKRFLQQTIGFKHTLAKNQSNSIINLKNPDLKPKKIFLSNNDNFVGIIGIKKIIVIDLRNEKQIYNEDLPLP